MYRRPLLAITPADYVVGSAASQRTAISLPVLGCYATPAQPLALPHSLASCRRCCQHLLLLLLLLTRLLPLLLCSYCCCWRPPPALR